MKSRVLIQISFHPTVSSKIKTENTLKFHGILFSFRFMTTLQTLLRIYTIKAKHFLNLNLNYICSYQLGVQIKTGASLHHCVSILI